jgi:hypothetical protein
LAVLVVALTHLPGIVAASTDRTGLMTTAEDVELAALPVGDLDGHIASIAGLKQMDHRATAGDVITSTPPCTGDIVTLADWGGAINNMIVLVTNYFLDGVLETVASGVGAGPVGVSSPSRAFALVRSERVKLADRKRRYRPSVDVVVLLKGGIKQFGTVFVTTVFVVGNFSRVVVPILVTDL